ncbi:MAG: pilin [Candidatus Pacebacteria bacterium]|nr:pilin [Candidatus Paceibacterota bacterium]
MKKVLLIIIFSLPVLVFAETVTFESPIKHNTFGALLNAISNFVTWTAIALVPIMVLIAAFQMFGAGDNPEKVKSAKDLLKWTAIGLAIVLSAKALYSIIRSVVDEEYEEESSYNIDNRHTMKYKIKVDYLN